MIYFDIKIDQIQNNLMNLKENIKQKELYDNYFKLFREVLQLEEIVDNIEKKYIIDKY